LQYQNHDAMIKKVTIQNFQSFTQFKSEPSFANINLIIGENDTGKTGLLKILYAGTKALEEFFLKRQSSKESYKKILGDKINNVFQPQRVGLGELVRKNGSHKLRVDLSYGHKTKLNLQFNFGGSTTNTIVEGTDSDHIEPFVENFNTLFIPAKEVLTSSEAIAATRRKLFMFGFDDTYLDLIDALNIKTIKGNVLNELSQVNKDLEALFEGTVVHGKDVPFIFKKGNTEYTMSLTAEGVKKIGILTTLIRNRQLTKDTILFMDEPDSALHPKAVRALARMIVSMAKGGVQLFISSHNYFMVKQLSILADQENLSVNCYSLFRGSDNSTQVEYSDLRDGVPDNPIIQEALDMFNEELQSRFL